MPSQLKRYNISGRRTRRILFANWALHHLEIYIGQLNLTISLVFLFFLNAGGIPGEGWLALITALYLWCLFCARNRWKVHKILLLRFFLLFSVELPLRLFCFQQ